MDDDDDFFDFVMIEREEFSQPISGTIVEK